MAEKMSVSSNVCAASHVAKRKVCQVSNESTREGDKMHLCFKELFAVVIRIISLLIHFHIYCWPL